MVMHRASGPLAAPGPRRASRPLSEQSQFVVPLDAMTAAALHALAAARGMSPEDLLASLVSAQLSACADAAMGDRDAAL